MALHIETELPRGEEGRTVPVFDLRAPGISPDRLPELAQHLGAPGDGRPGRTEEDGWMTYEEGSFLLDVHAETGGLVFRDAERYGIEGKRAFELGDEEAAELATRFLHGSEIVPADEAEIAKVTHLRGGGGDVDGNETYETVIDAGVVFRRRVADLPVTGPGGLAMINLDPAGDVVAARRVWRPLGKPTAEVTLQGIDRPMSALEDLAGRVVGELVITKAELGYFEQGMTDPQRVLEPAYAFVYLVKNEEVVLKSAAVFHAGDQTFEKLEGPKRFPMKEQSARE